MKFVIITHAAHIFKEGKVYAYGPYVREMNLWAKYVDEIIIVAPISKEELSSIHFAYTHANIKVSVIHAISFTSVKEIIRAICFTPIIKWKIFVAFLKADHIHLRCPGNIGLLGAVLQVFFPNKQKTAKYAGNWDPQAKQPLSYRLQKWILRSTFLTKNMQVLVYGDWPEQTKNIKSFFTATYPKSKVDQTSTRGFGSHFKFLFVGSLSAGKRPLYAIKLVAFLLDEGVDCSLDLFGDGDERSSLESYIRLNDLTERVKLHGNQTAERVESAYKESHFLILPSKSEGWPKVVAEAMFWGSIPIVPKISCVPWMLGNGERGILIEMDFDRDVTKVLSLLSQQEKLIDISAKAQNWSQNYTLDVFESEIVKLL
ncbi:MAG: glycosyltransferase involved in cell wall biosynthesis [Flavobacteriaceae bacterium]|jgi:glycosyltransferase involved in cell wall biosynthesis